MFSAVTRASGNRNRVTALPMLGFVYILFRPVSNGKILLPILLGLALCGLVTGVLSKHRLARPLMLFLLIQLLFATVFALVGVGNPGVGDQLVAFLGFPVVFWMMIYGISERMLARVIWAVAIGCTIVGLTLIVYVGYRQGVLPQLVPARLLETQTDAFFTATRTGRSGGAVRFYGLATLAAGTPIWVASLLVPHDRLLPPLRMRLLAAVSCAVAALVAGRQAIVVTSILAPAFFWLVSTLIGRARADAEKLSRELLLRARRRRIGLVVAMVAGVLIVGKFSFRTTPISGSTVTAAFRTLGAAYLGTGAATDQDTLIRQEESRALLAGFGSSPIFGHGLGAALADYRRDDLRPWNFELQYHMLLFDSGLIGVLFAVAAVGVLIYAARRAMRRRPDLAGCLAVTSVGCLAMLAAAASNPYLQAPGYHWALYLPLAVINVALTSTVPSPAPAADAELGATPPPRPRSESDQSRRMVESSS